MKETLLTQLNSLSLSEGVTNILRDMINSHDQTDIPFITTMGLFLIQIEKWQYKSQSYDAMIQSMKIYSQEEALIESQMRDVEEGKGLPDPPTPLDIN